MIRDRLTFLALAVLVAGCSDATGPEEDAESVTKVDAIVTERGPSFMTDAYAQGCTLQHNSGDACRQALLAAGVATGAMVQNCLPGLSVACVVASGAAGLAWNRWYITPDAFGHRTGADCNWCSDPQEPRDWSQAWDYYGSIRGGTQ